MTPAQFFQDLRGIRRTLTLSTLVFVLALIGLAGLWSGISLTFVAVVEAGALLLGSLIALRFETASDRSLRASMPELSTGSDASCESHEVQSCASGACASSGISCETRFVAEMSQRIMLFEQSKLRGYVGHSYLSQLGLIIVWPLVTLIGVASGALPFGGGVAVLAGETAAVVGFSLVRLRIRRVAVVPEVPAGV